MQINNLFCYRLVTGSGAIKIMPPATITQEKQGLAWAQQTSVSILHNEKKHCPLVLIGEPGEIEAEASPTSSLDCGYKNI